MDAHRRTTFEAPNASRQGAKITVRNDSLKNLQQLHAWAIVCVPILGSVVAMTAASWFGIGMLEIGLLVSMYSLTMLGVSVGFHRHFTHCTFQTYIVVRATLAILGSMACQGSLIYWVSNHRRHHKYGDQPEDPHSPYVRGEERLGRLRGLWHAHMGWTFHHDITNTVVFAKDLLQDKVISKINRLYFVWVALGFAIPTLFGAALTGSVWGGVSGLLWGGLVRLFFSYHLTNSINSIAHVYGRRPFHTQDQSTNNGWLAIPTFGEAWHNNHHAFPGSAIFGLERWQIDLGGWVLRTLERVGLVWNVQVPTVASIEAKKGKRVCLTTKGGFVR